MTTIINTETAEGACDPVHVDRPWIDWFNLNNIGCALRDHGEDGLQPAIEQDLVGLVMPDHRDRLRALAEQYAHLWLENFQLDGRFFLGKADRLERLYLGMSGLVAEARSMAPVPRCRRHKIPAADPERGRCVRWGEPASW